MAKNILLTSLSAADSGLPLTYFSMQKEFGFDYCDAFLETEAGIKAVLARHAIDEIIVICADGACDEKDVQESFSLRQGSALYSEDKDRFSAYRMLRYRLAQYADEQDLDRKEEEEVLSGDVQEKLIRFIEDYQKRSDALKDKKPNRLFDQLSQNASLYEDFRNALEEAFPEPYDFGDLIRWVKSYLYGTLKLTFKLELLPVNEKTGIRCIPEDSIEAGGKWVEKMMSMKNAIVEKQEDIDLYVALPGDNATDNFIVINLLNIMTSMPKSGVRLKKIFSLERARKSVTGMILDDTEGFGVAEVFHALHAFLNYGKADMIAKIWEKSGEQNESIASMVYAMRHVDVGLSMCNIPEMEQGILRLRNLFRDENFWRESGYYGMHFSVIAESIREDYGSLLEGDGEIPFIEMVKWAYRHQFYQQTLTLIESRAPENLVESGVFYYCSDEEQKRNVTEQFARLRMELKPYEYYKMDEIDHYFIKTYDRSRTRGRGARGEDNQRVYAALRTESVGNTDPSVITGFTACDSTETLQNLLYAYYHVGEVRNKISHADADAMAEVRLMVSQSDEISALTWMKESIDYFIVWYEKAMSEVQNKDPRIIRITGDEVRTVSEHLRRENRNEGRSEGRNEDRNEGRNDSRNEGRSDNRRNR